MAEEQPGGLCWETDSGLCLDHANDLGRLALREEGSQKLSEVFTEADGPDLEIVRALGLEKLISLK